MQKILVLVISLISFSFIHLEPSPTCQCPSSHTLPKAIEIDKNYVPTDIIIDNVNYGKPVAIGTYIFLSKDVKISSGTAYLPYTCPTGFRLPTKAEYESMLKSLGSTANSVLSNTTGFNFQSNLEYMTSDKVYPSNTDGSTNEAWCFYGLVKSGTTFSVKSVNSYWDASKMAARCIMDMTNFEFNIEGLSYDLLTDEKRTLKVDKSMLKGMLWRFNNQLVQGNTLSVSNTKRGCNTLEIWAQTLNNQQIYSCKIAYTRPKLGNSVNAAFSMNKVSTLNYTFYSEFVSGFHFSRPQAPIAPKYDGGYFMAYNKKTNHKLCVVEFDSKDKVVKDKELGYSAYPLDIIETDYGFAIYARNYDDAHHSFVVTYNFDYTKRKETTIMNNGNNPTTTFDALVFYDSKGEPLFGTNAMYEPHNGKLAYGQGRLNLIFAHDNKCDGEGHTGDTYYSLDLSGEPKNAKYAWSWLTSHSLIQSHIYDGKYFVTAALGDAYPEGITLSVIDINKNGNAYYSKKGTYPNLVYESDSKLLGDIVGNHGGGSYGRLAGVLLFDSIYAVVYSVKKSSGDSRDGIYLATFNYKDGAINLLSSKVVSSGIAGKLKNLRCAKYGGRILITYILNKTDYNLDYPSGYQDLNEDAYYLLASLEGKIIAGPFKSSTQNEALSEDIRELKDGSLRWGYVDRSDILRIVKVAAPTA